MRRLNQVPATWGSRRFWFSPVSEVLLNEQKARGYESPMWIEAADTRMFNAEVKAGAAPMLVNLKRALELWNLDAIDVPKSIVESLPSTDRHSSYATKKPYSSALTFELEQRATVHGYESKWWVGSRTVRSNKWLPKPRQQSSVVLFEIGRRVFNADQLTNPGAITQLALNGGRGNVLSANNAAAAKEHAKKHGFLTNVYFTENDIRQLLLETNPDADPVEVVPPSSTFVIYNVEQLEGWQTIVKGKEMPPEHQFAVTSSAIKSQTLLEEISSQDKYKSTLWYSTRDLEKVGLKVRDGETGIDGSALLGAKRSIRFFNVHQLLEPEAGFRAFGTVVR